MSKREELTIPAIARMNEDDARAWLERLRWPEGPVCPHCGVVNEAVKVASSDDAKVKVRDGVYNCRACRTMFTVTVGTIFEGSHVPLWKWVMAFYLLADSKKSVSALQLQRHLELGSYKTAWHLAHRVRHAMANSTFEPLTGVVEADEVYIGGKPRYHSKRIGNKHAGRGTKKTAVQVLVQRGDGGGARARAVKRVDSKTLHPYIKEHVAKSAAIHSDEWNGYNGLGKHFEGGHHVVRHGAKEYARGDVHSNSAESFNGLFKRAVMGSWHHISPEHLPRYLNEATFRWSHREESATDRTRLAIAQADGVRLYYRKPRSTKGLDGEGLVASPSQDGGPAK